ncbi:hypothetical protein LH506_00735 [Lapidilactobacillus dextrinicus]|uniref:hypothetical protein n=1 Tax=Lapidilactobacillus dextrinicus TaxID=51664 RepID=UPI000709DC20|nr:hypothetical protein [Lapidilactobacillus dextrinicus]QFG46082.1 hypothetical protein LH506_00735 [Lapidilactobacillus dextrinicus]
MAPILAFGAFPLNLSVSVANKLKFDAAPSAYPFVTNDEILVGSTLVMGAVALVFLSVSPFELFTVLFELLLKNELFRLPDVADEEDVEDLFNVLCELDLLFNSDVFSEDVVTLVS